MSKGRDDLGVCVVMGEVVSVVSVVGGGDGEFGAVVCIRCFCGGEEEREEEGGEEEEEEEEGEDGAKLK